MNVKIIKDLNTKLIENKTIKKYTDDYKKYLEENAINDISFVFLYKQDDIKRYENLLFIMLWMKYKINNNFKIYLVELDKYPKLDITILKKINSKIKYIFLYCPYDFNRGWGYNVICRHYCKEKIVILADVDLLFKNNIYKLIYKTYNDQYSFITPYNSIYQTTAQEKQMILKNFDDNITINKKNIKSTVTLSGGIIIANRHILLNTIGGFEEYNCYGNEDRALDVTIEKIITNKKIYYASYIYIHLNHTKLFPKLLANKIINNRNHLTKYYGCKYFPNLNKIHQHCNHSSKNNIKELITIKKNKIGNIGLYYKYTNIPFNGISLKVLINYNKKKPTINNLYNKLKNNYKYIVTKINFNYKDTNAQNKIKQTILNHIDYDIIIIFTKTIQNIPNNNKIILIDKIIENKICTNNLYNYLLDNMNIIEKKSNILIILGNGPSLKNINFNLLKEYDTFGLNAAYRAYYNINFWPTYFGCFDKLVCSSHTDSFNKLLENSLIKKFFFINQQDFNSNNKLVKLNFKRKPFNKIKHIASSFENFIDIGSSGANAAQVGIMLGYKKIILLGCDCNYIEKLKEAKSYDLQKRWRLVMESTPKTNPNYWFNDYQRKGDKYNLPNTNKFQIPSWTKLAEICPIDVDIVNCSPISKIDVFRKSSLENELV